MKNNYFIFRRITMGLTLFLGIAYMVISFAFLVEPQGQVTGFNEMLKRLQRVFNYAPVFDNLIFLAFILLLFVGAPNIMAMLFLTARMYCGIIFAIISSVVLIILNVFILIIYPLSTFTYISMVIGFISMISSVLTLIFYYKYVFYFNEADYNEIGYNSCEVVVYYARTIYMKKYAYELANSLGCEILSLNTVIDFKSNKGFFRYVKSLLLHRNEAIYDVDVSHYEKIYCVFESFASYTCPPMLEFFSRYGKKIKTPELTCVYFTPNGVKHYLRNLADYFITPINSIIAVKLKYGVVKKMYELKKQ